MIRQLLKISLFFLLLTSLIFPQLKELTVKPTENRGGIIIFRNYPDKAGIVFYTQFDNLIFHSTYGITKITGDPEGGKYILVLEPTRQTIEVRAPGYKTEMIRINSLEPREVLYYEVLPKKEEMTGVTEVGITVQATPPDATILLDGSSISNNTNTKVSIGTHNLTVEKSGYAPFVREIDVTPENTLFQITLERVQLSPVTIKSNPANATVYVNNEHKGTTEVGFFLFPGVYDLRIELRDYLPVEEKITVRASEDNSVNTFSYNLLKNTGVLELSVTPSNATITLNGNNITPGNHELNPGKYQLSVKANLYSNHSEEIEIKRGERIKKDVILSKTTGILKLSVTPADASININKERKYGNEIELIEGIYEVEISADTYYPETFTVQIEKGKTVNKSISLRQKTGSLQFTVKPPSAEVVLNQNGVERYRWNGLKIINQIPAGIYNLTAKAPGYQTYTGTISVKENETTITEIELKQITAVEVKNDKTEEKQNFVTPKPNWVIGIDILKSPTTSYLGEEYTLNPGISAAVNIFLGNPSRLVLEATVNYTDRKYKSNIFEITNSQTTFGGGIGYKYLINPSLYFSIMANAFSVAESRSTKMVNGVEVKNAGNESETYFSYGPGLNIGYLLYLSDSFGFDISARYNILFNPQNPFVNNPNTLQSFGARIGMFF
ncbi:MAG: PEGA domain-containing protein [Ignavibacteriales bacterium]|nr:MAG: PEGA domain-containing protein [Ignavibacteriaceae bacterium]MBW7872832.1 PEGA domain-containing protein [Ignavibacteria bacterium]MCZ2143552.1 PEGA domain-containing protein [Ignavibacteriales bacterium]OQY75783.1 MAG: hypothetical protein B6D45_05195 [Ignavibacteriales bacterium UTCHB3]MBV6444427.1 hypothetical protein [Ignavibacteriaceae bacterium]